MLLNRFERWWVTQPLHGPSQRRFGLGRLRRLAAGTDAGFVPHPRVLELGVGAGPALASYREVFGAREVLACEPDADLLARCRPRAAAVDAAVWRGRAEALPLADASMDAVFALQALHHVPDWEAALAECARVLRPGGRLYAVESLAPFLDLPPMRWLMEHPTDRFTAKRFLEGLARAGFEPEATRSLPGTTLWVVARRATG